jgi:hypothetical protein
MNHSRYTYLGILLLVSLILSACGNLPGTITPTVTTTTNIPTTSSLTAETPSVTLTPSSIPITTPTSAAPKEPTGTTFIVKVPSNTPYYSTIYMEWYQFDGGFWSNVDNMFKMEKLGADTWKVDITLSPTAYGADGKYFYYRYSRDKWGYPAAEEFTPDADSATRKVEISGSAGKTINDMVVKWRWFPAVDELPLTVPPSSAKTATVVPRVKGEKLSWGIGIQDFWNESYGYALDEPTMKAVKADGANSVSLGAPVWTFSQIDPLPIIVESSFYQLKGLENQLKLYKENGFHVMMFLQFGTYAEDPSLYQGSPFDTMHSKEWWDAWYQQVEKAILTSADLAEKYHVEMFAPGGGLLTAWGKAPDAEKRFSEIIDNIRLHYSGKVGASQVIGGKPPDWQIPLPAANEIPAFKKYDFVSLGLVSALAAKINPTQAELNAAASQLFNSKIKPLYDQYHKPVVLIPQISSFEGVLQDVGKYSEAETLIWSPYNPNVAFDGTAQAMAYEAIMNAVAGAEYVIGIDIFGYHLEEFPRARTQDVRSKPAEKIISGWYQRFSEPGL